MRRFLKCFWRKENSGSNVNKVVYPVDNLTMTDINDVCKFNGITVTKDTYNNLPRYTFTGGGGGSPDISKYRIGCIFNIVQKQNGEQTYMNRTSNFTNPNSTTGTGWTFTETNDINKPFYNIKNIHFVDNGTTASTSGRISWNIISKEVPTYLSRTYFSYNEFDTPKNQILIKRDGTEVNKSRTYYTRGTTRLMYFSEKLNPTDKDSSKHSPLYNGFCTNNQLYEVTNLDKSKVLWDNSQVVDEWDKVVTFDEISVFYFSFMGVYNSISGGTYKNLLASEYRTAKMLGNLYPIFKDGSFN